MKYLLCCLVILCIRPVIAEIFSAAYSEAIAKSAWQLTNAAYCTDTVISGWSCSNCLASGISLTGISTMSYDGSRGYVGYYPKDNAIYVSFMGSHTTQQWIDNVDTFLTGYPYCSSCMVHVGFYKAYLNIVDEVRSNVQYLKTKYSSASLRIFGHSLGGAVAVHCAADLVMQLKFVPEYVYTFGQPRVGDSTFSKWYDSVINNHYRVTHAHDPVPHLPLESMGFHHTWREVFYKGDPPNYKICDGSGEDISCSDQYDINYEINDHLTYMAGDCCCPNGDNMIIM